MALYPWKEHEDKTLGKEPCKTDRDSWVCPNMLPVAGDTSMSHEHYECKVCNRRHALDYDEMR